MAAGCGRRQIPTTAPPFTLPYRSPMRGSEGREGCHVFVVDDNSSIRDALRSLLRSVGLCVESFESARAFLTHQPPDAPGCLVLDVRLPGLSGLDLQRELAAAQITMPIIFTDLSHSKHGASAVE